MDHDFCCEIQARRDTSILSLPNELLTELFSWTKLNDVNNLKLACKRFYYAITDKYYKMNIKKAVKVSIKGNRYSANRYHNNIGINLEVVYLRYDHNNNVSERYFKRKIRSLETLLKHLLRFDLRNLEFLEVCSCYNMNIFKLLNKYYTSCFKFEVFYLGEISNNDFYEFKIFMKKVFYLASFKMRNIYTRLQIYNIYSYFGFSHIHTLEFVSLIESRDSNYMNRGFLLQIYKNNPNLKKLSLNTRNNELIKQAAVDFIYRHEKIGNRNCNHQDVELSIIIHRDLEGVWDFIKKKFENDNSLSIEIEVNKFLFIEELLLLEKSLFLLRMNIVSEDSSKKLNIWSYLPNEMYVKIFSYIPLIYLCNVKMVCKKFNLIVENNNNQMLKMVANEVQVFNSKKKKHLLKLHVKFIKSLNECNTPIYKKYKCNIRSRKEFIGRMRMFNLTNIQYLNITKCDKVEIFELLNECMKVNSNIYQMSIERLDDKNILYFKNFLKKFKSIKFLQIPHICTKIQAYEDYSYLQLLNIHDFENICLWECQNTRFLNSKFILDLYKNNPNLNYVRIHSNNNDLIKDIGVNFFSRQELNNDVMCNHTKMELVLDIRCDITELLNTIKNVYRSENNSNIRERQTIICYGNAFIKVEKLCQICLNYWLTMKLIITNTNFTFHG
uniref:F-box domain-containing protein n=1 Tax=Strongyloides venezuelensis TaxID=75913 RepID=A0A0K0EW19_STRVS